MNNDSDWRIPLATDLALRAHAAGAKEGDRETLKKVIYTLAEQEKDFLERHPDKTHSAIGYARAVDQYGKNGLGQLISLAFKFWPSSVSTVDASIVDRAAEIVPVPKEDPPAPKRKPSSTAQTAAPSTSLFRILEPVELAIQITTDQPYDEGSVVAELQKMLSGTHFDRFVRNDRILDISATVHSVSEVREKICSVPWVTDALTKPAALFGVQL